MKATITIAALLMVLVASPAVRGAEDAALRVGAAAVELQADDSMVIAGSILPGRVRGQEGKLRATAVVVERSGAAPIAIVSCDVLFVTRDFVDPALARIEKATGIPAANVLVHATHTHHAPSTARVHGYGREEVFVERLKGAIVEAVIAAKAKLADATFAFKLGQEKTVGMNSRLRLADGTIYWIGPRDDVVGPTGPFDPDLPVLAFRAPAGKLQALLFGHSTHTIGGLKPGVRSPAFYGMVAQELESELGGGVAFLEGASGSTHEMSKTTQERFRLVKQAVLAALAEAKTQNVAKVAALKRPFRFKIRTFNEAAEEKAVADYCNKRAAGRAESTIQVFRDMRRELAPMQGQERTTWLQTVAIGDVAVVGVPAEFFTKLGIEIKRRSPFPHTVIAELSNDWIGYVGDADAYKLGGYQLWMGLHSYCEPDTGQRIVDETVNMLGELRKDGSKPKKPAARPAAHVPDPPPPRNRAEVEAVLAKAPKAPADGQLRPLDVVLLADKKDHGPEAHDYPLWQKRWSLLLGGRQGEASTETQANLFGPPSKHNVDQVAAGAARVKLTTAWEWPSPEQFKSADLVVMFCYRSGGKPRCLSDERVADLEGFLARGGGFVLIHSPTYAARDMKAPEAARELRLTGAAFDTSILVRHGPITLELTATENPICLGLPKTIQFFDEPYWPPVGDLGRIEALAASRETVAKDSTETALQPMYWTYCHGKGRVFACVPGHFTWTFDDPYFRILLLRGMAWAAGESPYRFDPLVLRGARLQ